MKTLKIISIETDLRTAIEKSAEAYGLSYYSPREFTRRMESLESIKKFYLAKDVNGTDMPDVWFVRKSKMVNVKTGAVRYDQKMQKFSWFTSMHNGAAALVTIQEDQNTVLIGEYEHDREECRGSGHLWTIYS